MYIYIHSAHKQHGKQHCGMVNFTIQIQIAQVYSSIHCIWRWCGWRLGNKANFNINNLSYTCMYMYVYVDVHVFSVLVQIGYCNYVQIHWSLVSLSQQPVVLYVYSYSGNPPSSNSVFCVFSFFFSISCNLLTNNPPTENCQSLQ